MSGDLLWIRLTDRRIDLIDKDAFLNGNVVPREGAPFEERKELVITSYSIHYTKLYDRTAPTGGVISPRHWFRMYITPKYTGSIPSYNFV